MDVRTIENLIGPIEGYDTPKRQTLAKELVRFARSLEWIAATPGGRLLDLGSSGDLVPAYRRLLGFDQISCLDLVSRPGRQRLVHADGSIFEFDAHRLGLDQDPYPFPDACFDEVVAMEVIEHLGVDPMFMLAEANRVLKPGGQLLLTTPNITSLASVYLQLWSRHPAVGRQAYGPGITDRHNREYTPDEIKALLAAAGFEVGRFDTFDCSPPEASVRRVGRLLGVLSLAKPQIDCRLRGRVIRCASTKVGNVVERFPEVIYPRYAYYDYAAYDRELTERFGGRRYWQSNVANDEAVTAATKDHPDTVCVST